MEEQYNWELILKIALPVSLIEAYIFYTDIAQVWKWFSLIIGMFAAGSIAYKMDKRKNNIFTSVAFVFLVVLVVMFLKNSGVI